MIVRRAAADLRERLTTFSGVIRTGPRQIGKTTLARQLADDWPTEAIYLDLERPADRRSLSDADGPLSGRP